MGKNNKIGEIGEKLARTYLEEKGYEIRKGNFWTPHGEIDIIAQKEQELFFVEVKTRKSDLFGTGMEAITPRKLQKIRKTAEIYLTDTEWSGAVRLMFIAIRYVSKKEFFIDCILE